MQPGVNGNQMSVLAAAQTVNSQLSSTITGSFKGQSVTIIPGASATTVEDSLEELTFTMSETVSKKLADRTTQSKSFASRLHALMAKYVTAVPGARSPDELNQYVDFLKRQSQANPRDLERLLEESFGDDVESQVAALELLDELFTEDDHPAAKATIRELKHQWRSDPSRGPRLAAGENIALATQEFAGDVDTDAGLRSFYRTTVLSWNNPDDAYSSILARYAGEEFSTATDFLIRALGCEIQSLGPSCDPHMLKAVRDDIYYLQIVRRLHEQVGDLAQRMESTFGIKLCHPRTKQKRRRKSFGKSSR